MHLISESGFAKYDESLGLVFGFAIICKENGEDYFDLHGDHIPEDAMLKALTDFALSDRIGKVMHRGEAVGSFALLFPLTTEIAKAFEITTRRTGAMVAWRPESPEVIKLVKDGKFTGFSIGGAYGETEELPDD